MNYLYKGTNGRNGLITGNKYPLSWEWEDDVQDVIIAKAFLTPNQVKVGVQEYAGKPLEMPYIPFIELKYRGSEEFRADWRKLDDCRCTNPGHDDGSTTCWEHHDCTQGDCTHGE